MSDTEQCDWPRAEHEDGLRLHSWGEEKKPSNRTPTPKILEPGEENIGGSFASSFWEHTAFDKLFKAKMWGVKGANPGRKWESIVYMGQAALFPSPVSKNKIQ